VVKDREEIKVYKVSKVMWVLRVVKDQEEIKVHRGNKGQLEDKEIKVLRVYKVLKVI
jgi:hypothetical protein